MLESNLRCIRRRIGDAAVRAGRRADEVRLLAVTKSVDPETAGALAALGQIDLGENRADELERKAEFARRLGIAVRWHFVGHLQRNKAKRVLQHADVIHSVDSPSLLATLDRLAGELGRRPEIFLQVKLHPEAEKSGLDPEDVPAAVATARALSNLRLRGLMTMAPLVESSEAARVQAAQRVFEGLRDLSRTLDASAFAEGRIELSMGMSDDFEIAIAAGSDWVRIGTGIFAGLPDAGRSPDAVDPERAHASDRPRAAENESRDPRAGSQPRASEAAA